MNSEYTIENWGMIANPRANPYTAPELITMHLTGNRSDGAKDIVTSAIMDISEDNRVTTRSGTIYILGEPDPQYEKMFPNAKQRIFEILKGK